MKKNKKQKKNYSDVRTNCSTATFIIFLFIKRKRIIQSLHYFATGKQNMIENKTKGKKFKTVVFLIIFIHLYVIIFSFINFLFKFFINFLFF